MTLYPTQLTLDIHLDTPLTFSHFVAGENASLLAALQDRAQTMQAGALYFWGAPHSGRTHLLHACLHLAQTLGRATHYIQAKTFYEPDLPQTPGAILAVDDVEHLNPDAQIALFNSFNRARQFGQTLITTGNASPMMGLSVRDDLRTRIAQSLIFEIHPLSEADCTHLLDELAARKGLKIEPALVAYLLTHGTRDAASLSRTLDALDQASLTHKRPLTLPLLREVMQGKPSLSSYQESLLP